MRSYFRICSQLMATCFLTYLFLKQNDPQLLVLNTFVGLFDPLMALANILTQQWSWLFLATLIILGVTVFWGRIFCGWFCPVGLVLDLCNQVKRKVGWADFSFKLPILAYLEQLRWLILSIVLTLVLLGEFRVLQFDPLILWSRSLNQIHTLMLPWSLLGIIGLALIFFPRFWCRYLCPTGSFFTLMSYLAMQRERSESCVSCQLCVKTCTMKNISSTIDFGRDCLSCHECERVCQRQGMLKMRRISMKTDPERRSFLVATGAGLGLWVLGALVRPFNAGAAAVKKRWERLLRPPGSLTEEKFVETCVHCNKCIEVCPGKCLAPAGIEAGTKGLGTPRVVPQKGHCFFCMKCGKVCPVKAIIPVPRKQAKIGTAKINPKTCFAWQTGKCLSCVEKCPNQAIVVNDQKQPQVDPKKCTGCGACEGACPAKDSAIILTYAGEIRR